MENNIAACCASLEAVNYGFNKKYKSILTQMECSIANGQRNKAQSELEILMTIADCKRALNQTQSLLRKDNHKLIYYCGSWFLRNCLKELAKIKEESILYITGLNFGSIRTLDQSLNIKHEIQTTSYASVDKQDNRNVLATLNRNGQHLNAYFHAHPGYGINATMPSPTDEELQIDLEKGGYKAIGGIFNREGYVRFFSGSLEYEIEVIGKGVEKIDENIFKI